MKILPVIIAALAVVAPAADACTSMVVSARASATGRPLLWKHRDSSGDMNFVERTPASDGDFGFCALYNGGDSLLTDAWTGVNDAGFAIMNTASYNLAPDTAKLQDQEGVVMALALKRCATVDDFEKLLRELPRPMGVQANFGVTDARGGAAYFETNDHNFVRYDADSTPSGVLIRSNFSMSGEPDKGMGYIRYRNACALADSAIREGAVSPELLTEHLSRSFYHSLMGCDFAEGDSCSRWVVDQDFIPRRSSVASVVIDGPVMWTVIGYPPVGHAVAATPGHVPDELRPIRPGFTSPAAEEADSLRRIVFPIEAGSGQHYVDMQALKPIMAEQHRRSLEAYRKYYNKTK
ncbi:MAG: C45 family peptidase [Muribaculaceae bacterium]|nr:C45 family peptidase [Muribaculaceae bacterium]